MRGREELVGVVRWLHGCLETETAEAADKTRKGRILAMRCEPNLDGNDTDGGLLLKSIDVYTLK